MERCNDFTLRISRCWSAETSSDPDHWTPENPAWGQCAVSACLVQDVLGGEILWTKAVCLDGKEYSHYFNVLPNGAVLDMTRQQFPDGTVLVPDGGIPKTHSNSGKDFGSTRDYVLSYQTTRDRYMRLRRQYQTLSD